MGARSHRGVTGLPARAMFFTAAFTLAGNITISSTIKQEAWQQ